MHYLQISTNIDYISIMPAAVNTSLGYTAIYGVTINIEVGSIACGGLGNTFLVGLETLFWWGWLGERIWCSREGWREREGRGVKQAAKGFVKMVQCKFACLAGCPELFQTVKNDVIDGYYKKALDSHNVGEAVYRIAIDPKPKLRQCTPLCFTHLCFSCQQHSFTLLHLPLLLFP